MALELTIIKSSNNTAPNSRTLGLQQIFLIFPHSKPGPGCRSACASWPGCAASRSPLRD